MYSRKQVVLLLDRQSIPYYMPRNLSVLLFRAILSLIINQWDNGIDIVVIIFVDDNQLGKPG